jgi:hypothetical protein
MIAPFHVVRSWRAPTGRARRCRARRGAGGTTEATGVLINSCTPIQERFTLGLPIFFSGSECSVRVARAM